MDRIKRISFEVLEAHKSKFGEDFVENKKALNEIAIVRSKGLKNKVAGYITRFLKKQIREDKIKHDRSGMDYSNVEEQESTLDITESGEIDESGLYVMRRHRDLAHIYGDAPEAVSSSADYVRRHFEVVSAHLENSDYLMPQGFSLADILLMSCLDWARAYGIELSPSLLAFQENVSHRPALKRAKKTNYAVEI